MDADPIAVARNVAAALEALDIKYVIGGSVASTLHGEPRGTLDVDFAIQLSTEQVEALCSALEAEYYLDRQSMVQAALGHRHFNVIHLQSMVKVDMYVRPPHGIYAEEIRRAHKVRLRDGDEVTTNVASPEDTILQKLRWYQLSDGISDRQWRDVLGVVKAWGDRLDTKYLERWAQEMDLEALLKKVWEQAGSDPTAGRE